MAVGGGLVPVVLPGVSTAARKPQGERQGRGGPGRRGAGSGLGWGRLLAGAGCFGFHVSRSRRKPVRVLRRGVKIHRKGIFLDKHIWNRIAFCSVHRGLAGALEGDAAMPLGVLCCELWCPLGLEKERGWMGPIPR